MKRNILIASVLLLAVGTTEISAQNFLKKLGNAVKNEVKKELKKEVDKAIDKASQPKTSKSKSAKPNDNKENSFSVLEKRAKISTIPVMFEYGPLSGELNGHKWVDMGLPSGTRWAVTNIDAASAEQPGKFYSWGETTTKSSYSEGNTRTYNKSYDGDVSGDKTLDVATLKWGKGWRMPTEEEYRELLNYTHSTFKELNGRYGREYTNFENDNTLFLPAAGSMEGSKLSNPNGCGSYWSASPCTNNDGTNTGAHGLIYNAPYEYMTTMSRYYGMSVRAVTDYDVKIEIPFDGETDGHKWVDLGLPSGTRWATCNLGTDEVDQSGDHYRWGATKSFFKSDVYAKRDVQKDISSDDDYDAATASWGPCWYIPSAADFVELIENCTWEWTNIGRSKGLKVTSKINGKYIFLPAAGICQHGAKEFKFCDDINDKLCYWTSTNMEGWQNVDDAYYFTAFKEDAYISSKIRYQYGFSIRPVTHPMTQIAAKPTNPQISDSDGIVPAKASGTLDNVPSSGNVGGHEWVDLGLPSGVKWASCNLGALSANEFGDTFEWAEITPIKDKSSKKNAVRGKWMSGIAGSSTYDAATAIWGGAWRMPTKTNFKELIENCTWEVISFGSARGLKATSKINGNYIFLPLDTTEGLARYWASTPSRSEHNNVSDALLINEDILGLRTPDRSEPSFIRPILK